ncbi:hypothetical protein B0681_03910 [Moraxella porci DSM 25326]|uniref:Uncharacterized protein n=1 Tax=Moraxella porci DSM 25326 TaxID=573983 RepID=A0A1T0CU02_9GAMM|nr:hypothetical protein [Moraxella porci]OOS25834.1 hypothetical protein B0681_03910 [Moraxella porci DSM 25326]
MKQEYNLNVQSGVSAVQAIEQAYLQMIEQTLHETETRIERGESKLIDVQNGFFADMVSRKTSVA